MNNGKEIFQWHPAFYAAVQAELEEEKELLTFTNEYQLGTKPREVLKYLNRREGHTVEKVENGIYYVRGSLVPIQIIVLNQLPAGKNLWLRVLTNNLREKNVARRMLKLPPELLKPPPGLLSRPLKLPPELLSKLLKLPPLKQQKRQRKLC